MKKTIFVSLIAFLIVQGCSKLDDVSVVNPNGTQLKSVSVSASARKITTSHFGTYNTDFYLWCGNNEIDHLTGTMNFHCTMQFENDVLLFMNMEYSGSFIGENTGEVFQYKEITKYDLSKGDNSSFHFNVIGDKGSHFIVSGTYLTEAPWIVIDKAICQ